MLPGTLSKSFTKPRTGDVLLQLSTCLEGVKLSPDPQLSSNSKYGCLPVSLIARFPSAVTQITFCWLCGSWYSPLCQMHACQSTLHSFRWKPAPKIHTRENMMKATGAEVTGGGQQTKWGSSGQPTVETQLSDPPSMLICWGCLWANYQMSLELTFLIIQNEVAGLHLQSPCQPSRPLLTL